jgi:hypothetical protein
MEHDAGHKIVEKFDIPVIFLTMSKIEKTDAEWQAQLGREQCKVTRKKDKRNGAFVAMMFAMD